MKHYSRTMSYITVIMKEFIIKEFNSTITKYRLSDDIKKQNQKLYYLQVTYVQQKDTKTWKQKHGYELEETWGNSTIPDKIGFKQNIYHKDKEGCSLNGVL